mgnify:CR=1 FL=1
MKNLITILCLCLFWSSCGRNRTEIIEKYDNGHIKKELTYKNWELVRSDEYYNCSKYEYPNKYLYGHKKKTVVYLENSRWETYYSTNGVKKIFYNYDTSSEIREFSCTKYDTTNTYGRMISKGKMIDGVPDGDFRTYHKNGSQKTVSTYTDGSLNGLKTGKYPSDEPCNHGQCWGKIHFVENYKNNSLDGKRYEWYESGQMKLEENYKNGNLHGEWYEFYESKNFPTNTIRPITDRLYNSYLPNYDEGILEDDIRVVKKFILYENGIPISN